MDDRQKLKAQLITHEGRRTVLYLDDATPPNVTGGIGHNFTANPVPGIPAEVGYVLTDRQVDDLFEHDLGDAEHQLNKAFPMYSAFAAPVYFALVNMVFNMGIRKVKAFPKMHAALRAQDYAEAAHQMLDSDWAEQVGDWPPDSDLAGKHGRPGRAWELAEQVRTQSWMEG